MDRETFAEWSFEADRTIGLYDDHTKWEKLPKDEMIDYLEEADEYLEMSQAEWPIDIIERWWGVVDRNR